MVISDDSARDREFGRLYQAYFRRVCFFYSKQGFPAAQSEELAQDAFLNIYKGLGNFRGESNIETWIFRIVRNTLKNRFRQDQAQRRGATEVSISRNDEESGAVAEGPVAVDDGSEPERALLSAEKLRLLQAALAELPPQMREVLTLRLSSGLKYREIAERMNISIDTVKSHLFQARQKLKMSVGSYFEIERDDDQGGGHGNA